MRNTLVAGTILSLSLIGTTAEAGPDQTTRYLMNQHVSLMTWGMYKIDGQLKKRFKGHNISVRTTYKYDPNTIEIFLNNIFNEPGVEASRQNCKYYVNEIRKSAGVDPATGEPYNNGTSRFSDHFSETGFTRTNRPEDIEMNLDKKFRIRVALENKEGDYKVVKCEADLLDNEVLFPE